MIENNYFNYKNYSMSVKPNGDDVKVRLWERPVGDGSVLKLKASKDYDYENRNIIRRGDKTFSQMPMSGKCNEGKHCDFFVLDDGFKVKGKMQNGMIREVSELESFPQTENQFSKLGGVAKRVCKKLVTFVKENEGGISKASESIKQSKIFELIKKV